MVGWAGAFPCFVLIISCFTLSNGLGFVGPPQSDRPENASGLFANSLRKTP